MAGADGIGSDLDRWLEPFLAVLGHKKRRSWAPLCLRGLLGPSERKSLQPMAASLGLAGHDQLQHFIASPAWDDTPLWRVLAEQANQELGLGHFEGRSWIGLPRHALMTCIAFAYLQHLRLAGKRPTGSGKNA